MVACGTNAGACIRSVCLGTLLCKGRRGRVDASPFGRVQEFSLEDEAEAAELELTADEAEAEDAADGRDEL